MSNDDYLGLGTGSDGPPYFDNPISGPDTGAGQGVNMTNIELPYSQENFAMGAGAQEQNLENHDRLPQSWANTSLYGKAAATQASALAPTLFSSQPAFGDYLCAHGVGELTANPI